MARLLNRDETLKRLSILDFILIDLGLYLNSNPEDAHALSIYGIVARDAGNLRAVYEQEFGPLCMRSEWAAGQCWKWIENPWPWEVDANFQLNVAKN